jgi:hypothetical protein
MMTVATSLLNKRNGLNLSPLYISINLQGATMKPQVIINNVDQSFFLKNNLDTAEVVTMLKSLADVLPRQVRTIVLDGETTGTQTGERSTRHPMIYALSTEERKLPVFISSKGRRTRNIGAKRVLHAIQTAQTGDVCHSTLRTTTEDGPVSGVPGVA